jgi:hypothetical protein
LSGGRFVPGFSLVAAAIVGSKCGDRHANKRIGRARSAASGGGDHSLALELAQRVAHGALRKLGKFANARDRRKDARPVFDQSQRYDFRGRADLMAIPDGVANGSKL